MKIVNKALKFAQDVEPGVQEAWESPASSVTPATRYDLCHSMVSNTV